LACWQKLGFVWSDADDIHYRITQGRIKMALRFFIEIFIIAAWKIWNLRNGKFFEGRPVSFQLWTVSFKEQILLQLQRLSEEFRPIVRDENGRKRSEKSLNHSRDHIF